MASRRERLVNFIRMDDEERVREPTRAILPTGVRYDAPNNTA